MLSSRTSITRLLLEALSLLFAVVVGWASFRLKALGYSVSFACIGPLSIHGIRYSSKSTTISIASIHFAFHIPRPSNPCWGTLTVIGYEHESPTCHFSISSLQTTLWFFPLLFRVSSGPWILTEVDEFRLRVFSSVDTPGWIQRLRVNLVGAILKGEILRCDEFATRLSLSSVTGVAEGRSSSAPVEKPGVERPDLEDEIRITTDAKAYETKNWLDRIYSFGRMQAQLRKSWVDGRGSFVLVCEVKFCFDPSQLFDLRITRLDASFDTFRIRDAELLRQGFAMMQTSLANRGLCFRDIFMDFLAQAIK
ncbi:hypothetical protein HWV62_1825 [Athelia sp. TMB]|nr:hypothetical protein HWV62_1825 [Athelia sp. TMB]